MTCAWKSESNQFLSSDFPVCSFDDCERQGQKRSGLCNAHREQEKRGEPLRPLPMTQNEILVRFGGKCRLDFCESETSVRGYCRYHYSQWARNKPFKVRPGEPQWKRECEFEGCDREAHSRGLCSPHAAQRRKGEPLAPIRRIKQTAVCSFEGCERESRSKSLCSAHYGQLNKGQELKPLRDYFTTDLVCEITWCSDGADSRGLCKKHRNQSSKYGLDNQALSGLLSNNVCEICGSSPGLTALHIDHDHSCCPLGGSCGKCVRGLLCSDCNMSLGKFKESEAVLRSALAYLERNRLNP